jgi:uncharacterized protein
MDMERLTRAWQRRAARRGQEQGRRAAGARLTARQAAAVLREEFGVEEVWLFGSLAAEPRHDAFDIDLAVRGLRPERYFHALARICDLTDLHIDLVTLESCSDRLRRAVAATGERIDGG